MRERWLSFWPLILVAVITFLFALWLFKKLESAIFVALILSELAWVLSFLPIGAFSLAGVSVLSYYTITEIIKNQPLKRIFLIFSIGLILILLTSDWFLS